MNVFNKIVVILLVLVIIVVVPLTLMFPDQAQSVLRGAADVIQANVDWLDSLTPNAQVGMRVLLSAIAMIVFVAGLAFLALEVIRFRRSTVRLKDGSGELMVNGIANHLAYYIDLLPGVLNVKPTVQSTGSSLRVTLHVDTAPGAAILEKSNEVKQTAREVIEEKLGLQAKEIRVVIKPVSVPKTHPAAAPEIGQEKRPMPSAPPAKAAPPVEAAPATEAAPPSEEAPPMEEASSTKKGPEANAEGSESIEVKAPPKGEW